MPITWYPEELQSPVAARKSTAGGGAARPLDPLPIVRLLCSNGTQYIRPQITPNFSLRHLFCTADLFRLPPLRHADPRPGLTYFFHEGGFDNQGNKILVLLRTEHPQNLDADIQHRIGDHLLLGNAVESELLYGERSAQAYEHPQSQEVIFLFPNLGVLQTGRYLMRYRVYDRRIAGALLGTCFGSPFTVFTGDGFPGLEPATPLTRSLAPLNVPGVRIRRDRFA
ncbi:hypothetical protein C8F01DRAFT_234155 [Mycena amicta]|nr:hypothetical protein C8F01DRAFT_234155 [Mycena amicta]